MCMIPFQQPQAAPPLPAVLAPVAPPPVQPTAATAGPLQKGADRNNDYVPAKAKAKSTGTAGLRIDLGDNGSGLAIR